jgi:hypothetical protein
MFNTDDFFKENPIEPETVFEHTEPVISIDDLIGTPVHGLFIKSKINSAFDWGTRSVLWKRELNKEIARLRKAAFSDEAQRVIQMGLITSKIEEISSYVPCIVVDDERSQWEDEQRAKRAKADEAKTTRFWEQYKERQAKGQTADDDDCNPPIPQSIENDSAGSQGDTKPASVKGKASKSRQKGGQDKLRTSHFIEWLNQNKIYANKTHGWIDYELRQQKPGLWGKNFETFKTWLKTDEAKEAKELLAELRLDARLAGEIAKKQETGR